MVSSPCPMCGEREGSYRQAVLAQQRIAELERERDIAELKDTAMIEDAERNARREALLEAAEEAAQRADKSLHNLGLRELELHLRRMAEGES